MASSAAGGVLSSSPMTRNWRLDVLRAVAAILVIGHHWWDPCPDDSFRTLCISIHRMTSAGWIGVDLFFVLSGFLVAGLLFAERQRTGRVRVGRFLLRRALRIYPAFYVFLAFIVLVPWLRGHGIPMVPTIGEILFLQNYVGARQPHTWSLAVEEHFYLLLGLYVCVLGSAAAGSNRLRLLPRHFAAVASIALLLRVANAALYPYSTRTHVTPTHLRLDALFFGVLLAYLFHFDRERLLAAVERRRWLLRSAVVCFVLPALIWPVSHPLIHTIGFTMLSLAAVACVLLAMSAPDSPPGYLSRLLAAIGLYSYSIYLWHFAVRSYVMPQLALRGWSLGYLGDLAIYTTGSIAVGIAAARLVEIPVLELRDRWIPRPARVRTT